MVNGKEFQKNLNLRIEERIESGCLLEKEGFNKLHKQILKEFPGCGMGKRALRMRISNIFWPKTQIDKALQEIVRNNPGLTKEALFETLKEEFCPLYPFIPLDLVQKRALWHRGITKRKLPRRRGRTLPGIGRIGLDLNPEELKKFKMPNSTFDNPFKIEVRDPENWSLMFLNGSNIGTRHGGDIVGNVSRRALSDANERGDVAIIATNIIALDLKKAGGPAIINRSLVFGDNINPDIVDPDYREDVKRILAEQPMDEIIYRTPEELIDDILNGWLKISTRPDNRPEYKGPNYIVLGNNENALINAAAYWEMRWWTLKKQNELRDKLSRVKTARKAAEKREEFDFAKDLAEQEEALMSQLHRTTISSIATQEKQRFYNYARAVVVKKIERTIPNSKVIGQDTSYVEIAGKKIEINFPGHNTVTDSLLANYAAKYGPKNLQGRMAPLVVICHPWSLQGRQTVREVDYDGKRGSAKIFVAPIITDDAFLRKILKPSTAQYHPLARAIFSEGFKSGVLRLDCVSGLVDADFLSVESLESFKGYPKERRKSRNAIYDRSSKYVWVEVSPDPHWGSRAKEFVTCKIPSSERNGMRLGMTEAVSEMMREGGLCRNDNMRVHLFATPDDQAQGQHFPARTQPHPHQLSAQMIEAQAHEMLRQMAEAKKTGNIDKVSEIAQKLGQFYDYQIEVRGTDYPQDQVFQVMERSLETNIDVFREILKSANRAGIIIRGVGEFGNVQGGGYDTRNCGIINIGSGNHFEKTVAGEMVEGPLYAKLLRALLAQHPEWRGKKEQLEKDVVAPLYSGEFIGWSILKTPSGYEYGLDIRATPTRMAGWGDTLLGATRNMPMRGNYSRIFNNRLPVLCLYGDKHFFGTAVTDIAIHHMCASGTHTDRFGELGFPPNNTGVSFVGLPVDGPDKGPVLTRLLPFDVIKDFVETNPRPFDWENFLPNPI
mgnify:CR=1 FL=1